MGTIDASRVNGIYLDFYTQWRHLEGNILSCTAYMSRRERSTLDAVVFQQEEIRIT